MFKLSRRSIAFAMLPLTLAFSQAQAAEIAGADLIVSATVLDSCVVTAPTALTFLSVSNSAVTNETTTGTILVVCTSAHAAVTVNAAGGDSTSDGQRRMTGVLSSDNKLPYNIFSTSARTSAVAVGGALYSGAIAAVIPTTISVYGQIPVGNYATDTYGDTIRVTLNY